MRRYLYLLVLLFSLSAWAQTQVTDSVTLDFRKFKDAAIYQDAPTFNYATATFAYVGYYTSNRYIGLFYPDLPFTPSDVVVDTSLLDTAILTVTYTNASGTTLTHVGAIIHNWVLGTKSGSYGAGECCFQSSGHGVNAGVNGATITATADTAWTGVAGAGFFGGVVNSDTSAWSDTATVSGAGTHIKSYDVTSLVRSQLAGTTYGFAIWGNNTSTGATRNARLYLSNYYSTNWNLIVSLFVRYKTSSRRDVHRFQANSDLVKVCPARNELATVTAVDVPVPAGYQVGCNHSNQYRIRQAGTIERVRLFLSSVTDLDTMYVMIWRRRPFMAGIENPAEQYDLVTTSENIAPSLTADSCTVDLVTPLTGIKEGDYVGWRIASTGGGNFLKADTIKYYPNENLAVYVVADTGGACAYYINNSTPATQVYNWTSGTTKLSRKGVAIQCFMQAPQVVWIGNSITSGATNNYSFLNIPLTQPFMDSTIESSFWDSTKFTFQNMGIYGDRTSNTGWATVDIGGLVERYVADAINLHPKMLVIEDGINNVSDSINAAAKAAYLSDMQTVIAAAQASSSIEKIYLIQMLPWTAGTTAQMQARDDWRASLAALAPSYSKVVIVNADTLVGVERAGGDAGNYWDMQTGLKNADNLHWMYAGNKKIAQAVLYALYATDFTTGLSSGNWQGGFQKSWRGGWSGGWQ